MAKIKKINVLTFARFQAFLFALLGLLAGIIYSFGGFIIDALVSLGLVSATAAETPGLSYGTLLAFGALIGMPIIFAVLGLIVGLIGALLYNLLAKWFGGFDFDMDIE